MKQNFTDSLQIEQLLDNAKRVPYGEVEKILHRAELLRGLSIEEVAALLVVEDEKQIEKICLVAKSIKQKIFGNRVGLFAPLYVSDFCVNRCGYCSFNCTQKFKRKTLTFDELKKQIDNLASLGHNRIVLEAGEDPVNCPVEHIVECTKIAYQNSSVKRVDVNIAATTVVNFAKLRDAGVGSYILFQETYHKPTYQKFHLSGPRADFDYHTTALERAMQGGIDDVGGGVLFGLYKPEFEVLALLMHNQHLEKTYGVGFHTVSLPRICKKSILDATELEFGVSDAMFRKLVAIVKIALPYCELIAPLREQNQLCRQLLEVGVSVTTSAVPLSKSDGACLSDTGPTKNQEGFLGWMMEQGFVPSFCNACKERGLSGEKFVSLAKTKQLKELCSQNSLLSLLSFAQSSGSPEFQKKVGQFFLAEAEKTTDPKAKQQLEKAFSSLTQAQSTFH